MRVPDLDRDMSHVIPVGTTRDSEFLFARMEAETLDALRAGAGARVLDVAAGVGQDGRAIARRGGWAVGAEPSRRMTELARVASSDDRGTGRPLLWVRAWSEALPFRGGVFDGAFCKGALDHFDDPDRCIAEAARVTRRDGRVVVAVANYESIGCRLARLVDRLRLARRDAPATGRRLYDVPSDHFTRYDPAILREQLERHLVLDGWVGVSLLWGVRGWGSLLGRVPEGVARALLRIADRLARALPGWADVVVASGRPRVGGPDAVAQHSPTIPE